MADLVFKLKEQLAPADAERLSERVQRVSGVTSANVDAAQAKLYVTFDTRDTGDIELERVLQQEGFHVDTEDVGAEIDTQTPGWTDRAFQDEVAQEPATRMAFLAEDWQGKDLPKGGV